MISDRNTVILYTAATCPLKCSYCYIDKNVALLEIDKLLGESFQDDYYHGMICELFPSDKQLVELETWGGEPFLHMDRLYHTLDLITPDNVNLKTIASSTNMAFDGWNDQFFGLMNKLGELGKIHNRQWTFRLQVSIDGPERLNDINRGTGTYQKIRNNFDTMIGRLENELSPDINLEISFKSTFDADSLWYLRTDDGVIAFYRPFDEMIDQVVSLDCTNVKAHPALPNFAGPCLATVDTGKEFDRVVRRCIRIENTPELIGKLKHHRWITPMTTSREQGESKLRYPNFTCGSGYTHVGILPSEMISVCHNGFVQLIEDYNRLITENDGQCTVDTKVFMKGRTGKLVMSLDDYREYETQMSHFNSADTSARLATIASQIRLLAEANEVSPEYRDQRKAIEAAEYYQRNTAYCVRDNYATTGSLTMIHNGLLKLLFNGVHRTVVGRCVNDG